MVASGPFDELPRLMRLSSENIYRLMHLSPLPSTWHEETLTDVLRGHLAGAQYRIVAPCPVHGPHRRCEWSKSSARDVAGRIQLSTKHEESTQHGADILLVLTNGDPRNLEAQDEVLRFFIKAKRVRSTKKWIAKDKYFKPDSSQLRTLIDAAEEHGAEAYYLFCVQSDDVHDRVNGICEIHTLPQDCAAMLVRAEAVRSYLTSREKERPKALLQKGIPLRCLADDCLGRKERKSVFERIKACPQSPKPQLPSSTTTEPERLGKVSPIVINPSVFVRSDANADGIAHGDALVVILGRADPNPDGRRDGTGENRRGAGWDPDYSSLELQEAARQWWVLSAERALTVRHLVAVGEGEVKARYSIVGGKQVPGGRYEFDVEELKLTSSTAKKLISAIRKKLSEREPGARNPVTYISI